MVPGMTVVALGADHAGFPLKEDLKTWLISRGYDVVDLGTQSAESVDYPDFAVGVGGYVDGRRIRRRGLEIVENLLLSLDHNVLGLEILIDVDAEF